KGDAEKRGYGGNVETTHPGGGRHAHVFLHRFSAAHRCAGLRRRQENQGQEAACSRRYIRPAASRCCPSCQRPRSRWSHSRHGDPVRDVSLSSQAVRRGCYEGPNFSPALAKVRPHLNVEIVKRSDRAKGFVVLSKRWIVERTLAWLNRCRRLAKDWESRNRKALAFLHLASI